MMGIGQIFLWENLRRNKMWSSRNVLSTHSGKAALTEGVIYSDTLSEIPSTHLTAVRVCVLSKLFLIPAPFSSPYLI